MNFVIKFIAIKNGETIENRFKTDQENSLCGAHKAMVDVLPELEKMGFVPYFYELDGGYKIKTKDDWINPNIGAMIDFQAYKYEWWFED